MDNYKGVYAATGKFHARIFVDNKQYHLGRFRTGEEAAHAYDCASYVLDRLDANFPDALISLGSQQRMLNFLIGKGAIIVPDSDEALALLVIRATEIFRRIDAVPEGAMIAEAYEDAD